MPDLGLSTLADEQLLNLANEVVMEILSRDPVLQRAAHQGVLSLADKREAFMSVIKSEVGAAKAQYLDNLRRDVRAEVVQAVQAGELNVPGMVGAAGEAKVIVEVTKEEIKRIQDDLRRAPEQSSFSVRYHGGSKELECSYHAAGQNWDARRKLTVGPSLQTSIRKAVLSAFGIPEN